MKKKVLIKEADLIGLVQEQISRIQSKMGLLTEENQEKEIILIDGTSSAGKSQTAKLLKTVPFYESTDPNQWVQIDSDMFVGSDGEERRLKLDHPNIRQWAKETGEAGIVSGLYRKDGVDLPENPYEDEYIEGTDPRNWYMAQEVKVGGHNKIIIDDIGNVVLKYLPNENVKNLLLHAPIYILLKNVGERNDLGVEPRDPKEVLNQYLKKYEATTQKPSIEIGDPTTELTKDGLIGLLKSNDLDDKYINNFLNELGVDGDGVYYIKVKDHYMTPTTKLINVDSERTVYLDQFKDLVKNNMNLQENIKRILREETNPKEFKDKFTLTKSINKIINNPETIKKIGINEDNQLSLDFGDKDPVLDLLEDKFNEIISEIKDIVLDEGRLVDGHAMDEDSYDNLESIYDDKIFPLWKQLHKLGNTEIGTKFNELEDFIVDFLEIYKEHSSIKKEMDSSLKSLEDFVRGEEKE